MTSPLSGAHAPRIAVIATLDTKAAEASFIYDELRGLGNEVTLIDSGVNGEAIGVTPSVSRYDVATAAGTSLAHVRKAGSRGEALAQMARGLAQVLLDMLADGALAGALCVGGAGATIAGRAFQRLPVGVPKLIVSPLASGSRQFSMFVGTRDVMMMHSVTDIFGLNEITETVLRQAAGAMSGMVASLKGQSGRSGHGPARLVAASLAGNTTKALTHARSILATTNIELVCFHANGVGGRAMEDALSSHEFHAVLDYTTTEVAAHIVGGLMDAGPKRMEIAGELGIPRLMVPGCMDLITAGPLEDARRQFPDRKYYNHDQTLTLVQLNHGEKATLGKVFGQKALVGPGTTRIAIPQKGFSIPGSAGGAFWDPEGDAQFIGALLETVGDKVPVELIDANINDEEFVRPVTKLLQDLVDDGEATGPLEPRQHRGSRASPALTSGNRVKRGAAGG